MAKKKQTENEVPVVEQEKEQEVETQKENAEVVETEAKPETSEVEVPAQDNEFEKEKDDVKTEEKPQDAIPAIALAYLKRHVDVKEVYIDKLGGVFSANTPKVFLKDAALYQNPFYKQ